MTMVNNTETHVVWLLEPESLQGQRTDVVYGVVD